MRTTTLIVFVAMLTSACVVERETVTDRYGIERRSPGDKDDPSAPGSDPITAAGGDGTSGTGGGGDPATAKGTLERPFPKARWLYEKIPTSPVIDPDNGAMVKNLNSGAHGIALNEFGIPFYAADAATPKAPVTCTQQGWGDCAYVKSGARPLTAAFVPHTGSDGAMVVIDTASRKVDEYWQFKWNNGAPTTTWGFISDLDGDGLQSQATGSGVSRAAGITRAKEIAAGAIDHALVFATSFCKTKAHRAPAWKDDGKYAGPGGVPEGARIQIDPALSPDAYGLNKAERAIMVALQTYGAYNIDCTGAPMAFSFEEVPGNPGADYAGAGLAYDYYDLAKLPWSGVRVLASWEGK